MAKQSNHSSAVKPGLTSAESDGDPAAENEQESGEAPADLRDQYLRIELEIERGGPCVMDDIGGDIVGVDVQFENERCRAEIDVREHEEGDIQVSTKQFTSDVCEYCPGQFFSECGCIPRYLEVETGSFVIETYLPDNDTISSLVNDIRTCCERVEIRSLTPIERRAHTDVCSVDLSSMTPKQREAVHWANELGYYDPVTSIELGDVADRLGISPSALSQRLQRAEANIFRQLSCECSCWQDAD